MSYIIENKVGKYTYLYECVSYRDKTDKKVRGKRKPIGKVDPATGERHFYPEYIERMKAGGTPVEISGTQKVFSAEDIKKSTVLECGAFHLLRCISEKNGLIGSLEEALPRHWKEIFMLASHLVMNGEPFMHCADWLEGTESYPVGDMSSQRVSDLLFEITPEARDFFYQTWCRCRRDKEYLAIDITSVSSYSELVEDAEWGHNRDGEELPQVNICLLMGEESKLPIYQTVYSGSLGDVSTLKTTLCSFDKITDGDTVLAVMDKGFFSKKNVDEMMSGKNAARFIIAVPFTSRFAKSQVDGERKDIDAVENAIRVGNRTLRVVTKERVWSDGRKVHTHIYFDPNKAIGKRDDLFGHVSALREEAEENPSKYVNGAEHRKYLNIRKSEKSVNGYTVSIRKDSVEKALGHQGWLVIISNDVADPKRAINIYRAKDVIEKGFLKLKRSLDLGRLRVHSRERMQNKVFVGFVALVLLSQIHAVMTDSGLYDRMTMKQLLRTLAKQRAQTIAGERILYPPTKSQKDIYKAFGVNPPM
jgi:hypothetical protein